MKKLSEVISVGKLVGSRGASFRKTSTSKPDDMRDRSGKDVGAMRNFAHEKAAVAKAAASKSEREAVIAKRSKDAAARARETLRMAKEGLDEAKGKFVYDKPLKAHVAAMDKHSTDALKGMHDRWASDHRDMKSNPAHSERLLAAHHVLKNRGVSVPDLPQHKNLGMVKRFTAESTESSGTEARVRIKNVSRPGDPEPTSEKSKLSKQAEIKTKIIEERPPMRKIDFGLPADLISATRSILEKKTQVDLDPETDDKEDNGDNESDDDDDVKKESKHTTPKSDKEKKLAALAHPKDKITHKDVLVGRGVLKKEETEIDEGDAPYFPITGNAPKGSSERKRKAVQMALGRKNKDHPDWNPRINPQTAALRLGRKLQKEEEIEIDSLTEEQLEEVLKKSDPAGKWISDFVHSKDPKFAGKSKKERMKMALGAYYAKQRNEEVEQIDELEKSKYVDKVRDATDPSYGRGADHIIKKAGKEHGAKFAKDLEGIAYKSHFPRHGLQKSDPLKRPAYDSGPRITKAGKMHSVDARVMKGKISSRLGQHTKPNLPESEQIEYAFTNEEIERLEAIAAQLDEAKPTVVSAPIRGANQDQSGFGVKKSVADYTISDSKKEKVKEEVDLDEARGRPKKSGEAPEGDDTAKHPIQQLHKIAAAIQGNEPHFEHKDGSKTKVSKQLAKHITAVYGSMRTTQEKDDFANKLHANRQSMMTAVDKHVR